MKAEILAVGTEILLGDIVNTNAQFLAKELANMGITVQHQAVVGDNPQRLKRGYGTRHFPEVIFLLQVVDLDQHKTILLRKWLPKYLAKKCIFIRRVWID